jgi:hypothetical protein
MPGKDIKLVEKVAFDARQCLISWLFIGLPRTKVETLNCKIRVKICALSF